jgi:Cof subfamily protein (haloacid dehalogenase superfamily)
MKHTAIIFDIDGTAIDSPEQKVATERLVKAIQSIEQSYYLCAATGRVWPYAEQVIKSMQLVDPCIISGGTQICNPLTGEILWQCNLETADVQAAIAILKQYPEYMTLYNEYSEEDYLHGGTPPLKLHIPETEIVNVLEQKFVPAAIAPEIAAKLSTLKDATCTVVVSQRQGFNDLHITNKSATKEHAVHEVIRILGIQQTDTIGVGDNYNDIHIFNAVARKVAMGNSIAELKALADEVIGDVQSDGFATYLESLLA